MAAQSSHNVALRLHVAVLSYLLLYLIPRCLCVHVVNAAAKFPQSNYFQLICAYFCEPAPVTRQFLDVTAA